MIRLIASVAAFAAIASTTMHASAYSKPVPCPKCGIQAKPGDRVINPGAKRGIIIVGGRFNRVALNPQPLPPKYRGYGR